MSRGRQMSRRSKRAPRTSSMSLLQSDRLELKPRQEIEDRTVNSSVGKKAMLGSVRRLLYTSLVDVSLPYGPGVNERGFLKDMLARAEIDIHAVIPTPGLGLPPDLEGLSATYIPAWGTVRRARGWMLSRICGASILTRTIRAFKPDLLVVRAGTLPLPQLVGALRSGVPYVLKTSGDGMFAAFYSRGAVRRLLRIANNGAFNRVLRGATCIDVPSETQRDTLVRLHPALSARIHVVDNGVDVNAFAAVDRSASRHRLGFDASDVVVGYVGNFPMQRGGKEVIDVVAALRRNGVKGIVAGDGGQSAQCADYASRLGVADEVVICGEVEYGRVPDLMGAMDIGLSILRPNERMASEQKVRQYLASGLCVVGTAGSNDFLRGRAFARVIESTNPKDVVDAVLELVSEGRAQLDQSRIEASRFARQKLSLSTRNDERLKYWDAAMNESRRREPGR